MLVRPKAEWKAAPARRPSERAPRPARRLDLHHSVTPEGEAEMIRRIQADHQDRGWRDIAYSVVATRGGVWEGIGEDVVHLNTGARESIALLAVGNFQTHEPAEELINNIAWYAAHSVLSGRLDGFVHGEIHIGIDGHRDHKATACPGQFLYRRIPEINGRAAAIVYSLIQPPEVDMVIDLGDRGSDVHYVQSFLQFWGFDPGPADGRWGHRSADAARRFKALMRESSDNPHHLGDTGAWGIKTSEEYGAWVQRVKAL